MTSSDVAASPNPAGDNEPQLRMRHAYEAMLPAMMALKPEELLKVNIDVATTVPRVLGALPRIRGMREQIAAHLGKFDLARFDQLEQRTRALAHAHTERTYTGVTTEALPALVAKATKLREIFLAIAQLLVLWELLDPALIAPFKGQGSQNVGFELRGIAGLLRKEWARVAKRSGLDLAEVNAAEQLGDEVLEAQGVHEGPAAVDAVQLRQRAFTLFYQAYDDAGWAIEFLVRTPAEVEAIIPSLYPRRSRGSSKATPEAPEPATVDPPAANGGHGAPSPAAPATPETPAVVAPFHPPPAVPGGPGGNPFIK
jgi:hypothetical protein